MEKSLFERVKEIIVDQLGVEESKVVPGAKFLEDLGADSLDIVELTMRIEEEYGIEISDEEVKRMEKVKDIVDYLIEHGVEN